MSDHAGAPAAGLLGLPEALLHDVFDSLPLEAVLSLRAVCQALRGVAAGVDAVLVPEAAAQPLEAFPAARRLLVTHSSKRSFDDFASSVSLLLRRLPHTVTSICFPASRHYQDPIRSMVLLFALRLLLSEGAAPAQHVRALELRCAAAAAADALLRTADLQLRRLAVVVAPLLQGQASYSWRPSLAARSVEALDLAVPHTAAPFLDIDAGGISAASQLRHLGLKARQLASVGQLAALTNLRSLRLEPVEGGMGWREESLGAVVQLAQLTSLALHGTGWDAGEWGRAAAALGRLQHLELGGTLCLGEVPAPRLETIKCKCLEPWIGLQGAAEEGAAGPAAVGQQAADAAAAAAAAAAQDIAAAPAAGLMAQLLPRLQVLDTDVCNDLTLLLVQLCGHQQLRQLRIYCCRHSLPRIRELQLELQHLETDLALAQAALQELQAQQAAAAPAVAQQALPLEPFWELAQQLQQQLALEVEDRRELAALVLPYLLRWMELPRRAYRALATCRKLRHLQLLAVDHLSYDGLLQDLAGCGGLAQMELSLGSYENEEQLQARLTSVGVSTLLASPLRRSLQRLSLGRVPCVPGARETLGLQQVAQLVAGGWEALRSMRLSVDERDMQQLAFQPEAFESSLQDLVQQCWRKRQEGGQQAGQAPVVRLGVCYLQRSCADVVLEIAV
jgi:hypothetical protein